MTCNRSAIFGETVVRKKRFWRHAEVTGGRARGRPEGAALLRRAREARRAAPDVRRELFFPPPDRRGEGPLTATKTSAPPRGRTVGRRRVSFRVLSRPLKIHGNLQI